MFLTGDAIRSALITAGIPAAVVGESSDATYKPAQSGWLTGDFHRWYFRALEAFSIRDFTAESGDCDDFTDLYCALVRIAHRRTAEGKGTALPIGRLNFLQAPNAPIGPAQQKHALVWAITSDAGLVFIEPQVLGRTERLTVAQLNSATRCTD